MSGHEAVKAALVEYLADGLPDWVTQVEGPTVKVVAASDILPDKDEGFPCVLVSSTRAERVTAGAEDFVVRYDVSVTVAAKATTADLAAQARDRLLLAVRWLLLASPGVGESAQALTAGLTEDTGAVAVDAKGRPTALGSVSFGVQVAEALPVLGTPVDFDFASVVIDAVDAAGSL